MKLLKYLGPRRLVPLAGFLVWTILSGVTLIEAYCHLLRLEAESRPTIPFMAPAWQQSFYSRITAEWIREHPRDLRAIAHEVHMYIGLTMLAAALTGCMVFVNFRGIRRYRAEARGHRGGCRACGYSLTGNVSGVCPECGARAVQLDGNLRGSGQLRSTLETATPPK